MARNSGLEAQSLEEIAEYHQDATEALKKFLSPPAARAQARYLLTSDAELSELLTRRLRETELRSCLAILSSIEAVFQIDYAMRCAGSGEDPLSREFLVLSRKYPRRVNLERHILPLWSEHYPALKPAVSELGGAFQFRHWLAHGRHWEPKPGSKYDYTEIYFLAEVVREKFPLVGEYETDN